MSKQIIHTFNFVLTEGQYRIIAREFKKAISNNGPVAILGQPLLWFGGNSAIRVRPPKMQIAICSQELYSKMETVLKEAKK